MEKNAVLLSSNPYLLLGINHYLPAGYLFELAHDESGHIITIITPTGQITKSAAYYREMNAAQPFDSALANIPWREFQRLTAVKHPESYESNVEFEKNWKEYKALLVDFMDRFLQFVHDKFRPHTQRRSEMLASTSTCENRARAEANVEAALKPSFDEIVKCLVQFNEQITEILGWIPAKFNRGPEVFIGYTAWRLILDRRVAAKAREFFEIAPDLLIGLQDYKGLLEEQLNTSGNEFPISH
ncbi:hypothetical protein A0H81_11612 [Grifola frondosa]|uniref:Uncharacterized protein n=1 Tax=Grifola frondosa TaxID=5627 RepID=A0A1C7LZZ0_GRIFR|nr:hypothetical protein A0H81_11612 [Grifola frondosa]